MTFEEYHRIKAEALRRMTEYTRIIGNYNFPNVERKEDDLKYWIAVVASDWKKK